MSQKERSQQSGNTGKPRRNWLGIVNLILIAVLGVWQGYTQYQQTQIESTHIPMEEVIPSYPATAYHLNLSELFRSEIVFSYSGEKTASYFVEWYVVNSEGKLDNIASLKRKFTPMD